MEFQKEWPTQSRHLSTIHFKGKLHPALSYIMLAWPAIETSVRRKAAAHKFFTSCDCPCQAHIGGSSHHYISNQWSHQNWAASCSLLLRALAANKANLTELAASSYCCWCEVGDDRMIEQSASKHFDPINWKARTCLLNHLLTCLLT